MNAEQWMELLNFYMFKIQFNSILFRIPQTQYKVTKNMDIKIVRKNKKQST
jgi:hypothetical protein